MNQCSVCIEVMNKSTRKSVDCGMCNYSACRACYKQYLIGLNENPHCMSCKKIWNHAMMISKFDKHFVNTEYKKHRENILVEREMSKMVETQPLVERTIKDRKTRNDIKIMEEQKQTLDICIAQAWRDINCQINEEKKLFIKKCPSDNCKGFLSSQWKCGLCNNWSCPECHVVVGVRKGMDGDVEHVCNVDTLATAKLLDFDTKMCPKCSMGIFKIDGCDMMFCTECHTSFSWKTGQPSVGIIHNPHYFEWLRQCGGTVERNPNEILCGREIDEAFLRRLYNYGKYVHEKIMDELYQRCRYLNHLRFIDLPRLRDQEEDNSDLRVKYMMNEISNDELKKRLQIREKQKSKKREYLNILEMFISCQTDLYYRLLDHLSKNEKEKWSCQFQALSLETENLVQYTNECLFNIQNVFGGTKWRLDKKFALVKQV